MEIKNISLVDYLQKRGVVLRKEGDLYFCSSPFSTDSTWSFCIYPTNTFYDWSIGFGGSIIVLHSKLKNITTKEAYKDLLNTYNDYDEIKKQVIPQKRKKFCVQQYVNQDKQECQQIEKYAESRGIIEGYTKAFFYERHRPDSGRGLGGWNRIPALGFVHVDENLTPCGLKLRRIDKKEPRFSARGKLGIYLVEPSQQSNFQHDNVLYVTEGEANANSLFYFLDKKFTVISLGAVGGRANLKTLLKNIKRSRIKLIIDYDGNEALYQERLKPYKVLDAEPIKLVLPKGQDINSLYTENKMYLIEHLL